MRIHPYLETVAVANGAPVIRCRSCHHIFCCARENYKLYALYRERDLSDYPLRSLRGGVPLFTRYQEFICPGCGTLLEVDLFCPQLETEESKILWDFQPEV